MQQKNGGNGAEKNQLCCLLEISYAVCSESAMLFARTRLFTIFKYIKIMAIIKYSVKENNTLGTHSFYGVAQSYSTLDFDDLADDVVEGLGISPSLVKTVLDRYMLVAKRNVLRGHRVRFGDLLTIYPQLSCSVKDELNDDGTVKKAATIDMFNLTTAKSTIGATIAQAVQQQFSQSVSWKRVTEKADGTDDTDDNPEGSDNTDTPDDNQSGGNNNQSQGGNGGEGDGEPNEN